MNLHRFKFVLRCLGFENFTQDKILIRKILTLFVNNSNKYYSHGENVMIDEKLESFQGCYPPPKYEVQVFLHQQFGHILY